MVGATQTPDRQAGGHRISSRRSKGPMKEGRGSYEGGRQDTSRHPVETVNWHEATGFCRKLSAMPAELAARRHLSSADRSRVGIRLPCGHDDAWYSGDDEERLGGGGMVQTELRREDAPGRGRKNPTPGACTTCTETSISGAQIGSARTTTAVASERSRRVA